MTRLDRTSLRGVWGTVLLPLDDSDRIDVPRLQHELDGLTSAGP